MEIYFFCFINFGCEPTKNTMNRIGKIILLVFLCLAVGYLASIVTRESVDTWYPTLEKPSFNPPNWLFMPVWTFLYVIMGVAGALVWDKLDEKEETAKKGLTYFFIQLALNMLWSYLFFGLKNPLLALIEIILLWLFIYETIAQFNKVNKVATYLFIPYMLWVSFAAILNASIWWLNK